MSRNRPVGGRAARVVGEGAGGGVAQAVDIDDVQRGRAAREGDGVGHVGARVAPARGRARTLAGLNGWSSCPASTSGRCSRSRRYRGDAAPGAPTARALARPRIARDRGRRPRRVRRRPCRRRIARDLVGAALPAAAPVRRRDARRRPRAVDRAPGARRADVLLGPDRLAAGDAHARPRPRLPRRPVLHVLRDPRRRRAGGAAARRRARHRAAGRRRGARVRRHARAGGGSRRRLPGDRRQLHVPAAQAVDSLLDLLGRGRSTSRRGAAGGGDVRAARGAVSRARPQSRTRSRARAGRPARRRAGAAGRRSSPASSRSGACRRAAGRSPAADRR